MKRWNLQPDMEQNFHLCLNAHRKHAVQQSAGEHEWLFDWDSRCPAGEGVYGSIYSALLQRAEAAFTYKT